MKFSCVNGETTNPLKIGFVGLGNMATAIVEGLIKKPIFIGYDSVDIYGYDVNKMAQEKIKDKVDICANVGDLLTKADFIVLAVKPQVIKNVVDEIKTLAGNEDKFYISIVAGKSLEWYENAFEGHRNIARCMPNTAALVGAAATAFTTNVKLDGDMPISAIDEKIEKLMTDVVSAKEIVSAFGKCIEVPEHLMDAVVGVSGSAPAYVFMFIEAMADAAVLGGMPRAQAYEFAAQAVYGSAKLMLETGKHPGELKDMVCSPAGTTIDAVRVLEEKNFRGAVMDAVIAATEKSKNL